MELEHLSKKMKQEMKDVFSSPNVFGGTGIATFSILAKDLQRASGFLREGAGYDTLEAIFVFAEPAEVFGVYVLSQSSIPGGAAIGMKVPLSLSRANQSVSTWWPRAVMFQRDAHLKWGIGFDENTPTR